MKLAIYRFGVVLFIAVLFPRALPAGQNEMKRAALSTDSNNPALQPKIADETRIQFGGVPALPTSFIIDAQGRVVQKHTGLRDPELYELEVRALLGLPINARVETLKIPEKYF